MLVDSSTLTIAQVLRAFHRDAPYLFLGASFMTAGVVALAFSALRRTRDALLIYFGVFAILYGMRLWIQSDILELTVTTSTFYTRLRLVVDYLVPIPAVLFLNSAGMLDRIGQIAGIALAGVSLGLGIATSVFGSITVYHLINNVAVIIALSIFVIQFLRVTSAIDQDRIIVRRGLLIFIACALCDNIGGLFLRWLKIEPFGFVVFLGSLGIVAARRTLQRDLQLSEIQKELEVARRIQNSILPAEFPDSQQFRVAARYVPMTAVAGDFYDYIVTENEQAGLLIADVSGHGVPAALIASMVKLAGASHKDKASDPSAFLLGMNAALYGNTQNQFITAAYVHLDSRNKELRYSAAGHPPMLLMRDGQVNEIEANGLMLAAFDFATYFNAIQPLTRGDRLLLYTDGIIEAANSGGTFLGRETLHRLLANTKSLSATQAADSILESVQRWSAKQDDDLTLVVCDFVGHA